MAQTDSPARNAMLAAGILGGTGVALGALGSHALKVALLERGMTGVWDTAAKYHLLHAAALLGLTVLDEQSVARTLGSVLKYREDYSVAEARGFAWVANG